MLGNSTGDKDMKKEYERQPIIIKIHSNFMNGTRYFKLTQLDYCEQKVEMCNISGEVISDFPLIWKGLTFDESKQRILDLAHEVRAEEVEIY